MTTRIATVEQQYDRTHFWRCRVNDGSTVVYLLPGEFEYSPVQVGDVVELTYQVNAAGSAGWTARKVPDAPKAPGKL